MDRGHSSRGSNSTLSDHGGVSGETGCLEEHWRPEPEREAAQPLVLRPGPTLYTAAGW